MKIDIQSHPPVVLDAPQAGRAAALGPPSLSVGETLLFRVAARTAPSSFALEAGNLLVNIQSDLPLAVGEKLTARVDQASPTVVLRLLSRDGAPRVVLREGVLDFMTGRAALGELFETGRELLNEKALLTLLPERTRARIGHAAGLLEASVFSAKTAKNPLYLKEYVSNLGLLLEQGLRRMAQGNDLKVQEGLKGLLMKISEELRAQRQEQPCPAEEGGRIDRLIKFAESSTRTIESHQLLNIPVKEQEGNFILQIPILCPDGMRTGELFIQKDGGTEGQEGQRRLSVAIFLTMDALGEMMVDLSLTGKRLTCLFRFDDPAASDFLTPLLDGLRSSLADLGYDSALVNCTTSDRVGQMQQEYRGRLFRDRCEVNLLI